jgi:pilus assembly protein Flp/PilA
MQVYAIGLTEPQGGVARFLACSGQLTKKRSKGTHDVWITQEPNMKKLVARFVSDESGATAIEYGLIAAGIAVVIIAAVQLAGTNLNTTWGTIAAAMK